MKPDKAPTKTSQDLIAIMVISLCAFLLGYFFDILEQFVIWTRTYEAKKIDEYVALFFLLLIGVSFFSFRRWRELKREIAERKKAEEEVQKLNTELQGRIHELTEANKELDAFNNMVSHDLRNSLVVVDWFTGRLLKNSSVQLDPNVKDILHIIKKNTQEMEQYIKDLFVFSRSGRQQIKRTEIDMKDLIRSILDELKPLTGGRTITFDIRSLPPAYGDVVLIRQVFVNLLSNAIKFTGRKDTAEIELGYREGEHENIYYVKDNGIGFDPHDSDKLFVPFQRLHEKDKFEGTGIGLSIVQRIVSRHGGKVWAEGQVGEGSIFYLTLPQGENTKKPQEIHEPEIVSAAT